MIQFSSYDRVFPNQDFMPNGGFSNLIALHLQGRVRKNANSEFFSDDDWTDYLSAEKGYTITCRKSIFTAKDAKNTKN